MEKEEEKRLFFGLSVQAPWVKELPEGRIIAEPDRHLTLSFLGKVSKQHLLGILKEIPPFPFRIGPVGKCDRLLFLPTHFPRVVAAHVEWLNGHEKISFFQKNLKEWLQKHQYELDNRDLLSHVTLARAPFDRSSWEDFFVPHPLFVTGIHLYESHENLKYESLWNHPVLPPFTELDHTADIAFTIYGETMQELHLHAEIALAFKFPALLSYLPPTHEETLDDIIIALNALITKADQSIGCPFKAVSFHGEASQDSNQLIHWEMIVDV